MKDIIMNYGIRKPQDYYRKDCSIKVITCNGLDMFNKEDFILIDTQRLGGEYKLVIRDQRYTIIKDEESYDYFVGTVIGVQYKNDGCIKSLI